MACLCSTRLILNHHVTVLRHKLLWIDCSAALLAGMAVLSFVEEFSGFYQLPEPFLMMIGLINVAYATYSFSLAARPRRPRWMIRLLVLANLTWAVLCVRWFIIYLDSAGVFGLAHLLGEAILVSGLALFEWRWQEHLLIANRLKKAEA